MTEATRRLVAMAQALTKLLLRETGDRVRKGFYCGAVDDAVRAVEEEQALMGEGKPTAAEGVLPLEAADHELPGALWRKRWQRLGDRLGQGGVLKAGTIRRWMRDIEAGESEEGKR